MKKMSQLIDSGSSHILKFGLNVSHLINANLSKQINIKVDVIIRFFN